MKKLILAFCLAVCYASIFAQPAPTTQETDDLAYIKANHTEMQQYIAMHDGKKLFCSIYTPKDHDNTILFDVKVTISQ